jgi:hypothetical protein
MFKRRIILISSALAVLALAGGAYAYWTTTGAGTGSATNASSNGTLVLHATFAAGLTPGATEAVAFTADNAGTSSLRVGTVTSVVSIDAPHVTLGCLVGDFTVAPVIENQTIAKATSGVALLVPGSIAFADTALNQDGCKGATITLTLSA